MFVETETVAVEILVNGSKPMLTEQKLKKESLLLMFGMMSNPIVLREIKRLDIKLRNLKS